MTPDWAKLGLREPNPLKSIDGDWMWRFSGKTPGKEVYRRLEADSCGGFRVYTRCDKGTHHPTIESAAAHLIRLGCGLKA